MTEDDNFPLQGRQGSRGCIPGSPGESGLVSRSILKEISPGISLEGMMLKLKLQYFGHLMGRVDSLEKTLMLGGIGGRRRRGRQRMRWLDGITDLPSNVLPPEVSPVRKLTMWHRFSYTWYTGHCHKVNSLHGRSFILFFSGKWGIFKVLG